MNLCYEPSNIKRRYGISILYSNRRNSKDEPESHPRGCSNSVQIGVINREGFRSKTRDKGQPAEIYRRIITRGNVWEGRIYFAAKGSPAPAEVDLLYV